MYQKPSLFAQPPQMEPPQVLGGQPTPSRTDLLANQLQQSRRQEPLPDFKNFATPEMLKYLASQEALPQEPETSGDMGQEGSGVESMSPGITTEGPGGGIGYPVSMMNSGRSTMLAGLLKGLGF